MRVKLFIILLFLTSLTVAVTSGQLIIETKTYVVALGFYWLFSTLYSHLAVIVKKGNVSMDYGVTYSISMGIFAGPLGIFILETLYRFTVYIIRKATKTADEEEFYHSLYNIGSFALNSSIAYYLFHTIYPIFETVPLGFWIVMIILVTIMSLSSDIYLIILFSLMGDIKTTKDAIDFIKSRSILDMGKIIFSNGLLLMFLQSEQWEMLIGLFLLNYLVSRSFMEKNQSIQHKLERDKFEQMAYTDFLTEVYNRAYMDKTMVQLNQSGEQLGIIVTDIDSFKRINDTYNHAVGDRVIQHFAATIQSYLDDTDFLFRSGGEEFTIFLRNRSYQECVTLIEQMKDGIMHKPAAAEYKSNEILLQHTASFGLYYYKACDAMDIKKAYVHADNLLLKAKDSGKNRLVSKNGLTDLPLSLRYTTNN
ncbi:diguanylate cyclase (GGDEF) domain-containing protein [Oceanobacillus limi]|uniref:Diguanylate cyclase (GGDEF) domain-containing protein n=1 Tax=Oceanobacillus limi TaxID=930131 RepID=A0A1I0F5E4_9BACI|nr:GGDEF domain-containing protein [Oceanobacillus limi]SET53269.1 diguanylate cyclase (GGDEF) domain-containing protein [Oceanobacillus limi]